MTKDELSMVGFEIVAYSGDARSTLLELLKEMRAGNFDNVEEKLKEADEKSISHISLRQLFFSKKHVVKIWKWDLSSFMDRII